MNPLSFGKATAGIRRMPAVACAKSTSFIKISFSNPVVRFLCSAEPKMKVAIVGTGPAGFYTARTLLRKSPGVGVDLVEMLPTPYGSDTPDRGCARKSGRQRNREDDLAKWIRSKR